MFLPFLLLFSLVSIAQQKRAITLPEMVLVQGGTFDMGSHTGVKNERPVHPVTVKNFYMGVYEVTQSMWQQVMGYNPSYFKNCPNCPVEEATPKQVDEFIAKLNELTGKHYRLPTEAEWEYAARGGNQSKGYHYPGSDSLFEVGWVRDNADKKTHEVGLKKPNELGLYDMSGNVWELCIDWWNPAYYKKRVRDNPANLKKAIFRVTRGGSWRSGEERCYNTARNRNVYDHHKQNCGFRLVVEATE
ncbi:MAG: formylglycine-generating enzyme family protein [Chitinophagales bacterium]|nr:formylglycine-generating enzyme family protein [Chitinophagales bacterium]